jgi:phage-related minor tail protein
LSQALLPEMTKLVAKLTELVADSDRTKQFVSDLSTVVSGTARVFEFAAGQVSVMIGQLAALKTAAEGVITLDWSQINRGLAMGLEAQARSSENVDRFVLGRPTSAAAAPQQPDGMDISLGAPMTPEERAAFDRRVQRGFLPEPKEPKAAKKEGKSDAERELERLESAYKSLAAQQRERIALFGNESEAVKVRYELESGELAKLTDAQAKKLGINKEELIANAERLDQLREEAEVQKELDRINAARTERVKGVLEDIQAEIDLLGKSVEYQDTYNKLKYAGVDANSAFGQSIIEANEALHEQGRAAERQTELMDTFRQEASSALSDVITGAKSLSDAFKDMFDNIAERITQMIADRWIEQLFGQTGSTASGSSGGWISAIASLFASANGNVFSGGEPVQAFANGGVVSGPTLFPMRGSRIGLMGEAGPEAIMPLERGSDGRLGVRAQGSAANVQTNNLSQNVFVQGKLDASTLGQMARKSGREAAREIGRTGR